MLASITRASMGDSDYFEEALGALELPLDGQIAAGRASDHCGAENHGDGADEGRKRERPTERCDHGHGSWQLWVQSGRRHRSAASGEPRTAP